MEGEGNKELKKQQHVNGEYLMRGPAMIALRFYLHSGDVIERYGHGNRAG